MPQYEVSEEAYSGARPRSFLGAGQAVLAVFPETGR